MPHTAQVNYFGTARCTRMALPYMRDSADSIKPERPHIVNVSATAGLVGLPFAGMTCLL
jgi:NAD(P)-dependent dehydrogenase (short-subunit alcohol dehydrogenase family)